MNYTLHQLQIFYKISQVLSITKAADELNLTQPAVSIQLKNFQNQFSIPLTEVVGRQLYITEFGKEIALAAEQILNQVEAINYKTLDFKGQVAGRLKISVVSTGKYVMPYFLSAFTQEHSGVDLVMDVTNKSRVVESLEKNEVDFALVSVIPEHLKVHRIELMANKLFLVGGTASLDNPLQFKTKRDFTHAPLLFREQGSATRNAMEQFLENLKITSPKKLELTSNEALKQAVIAGLGYSVMPLIGIKNSLQNKEVQIIPFRGLPLVTTWNLIWLRSKRLSPTAEAYLDYLRKEKENIIDQSFRWIKDY